MWYIFVHLPWCRMTLNMWILFWRKLSYCQATECSLVASVCTPNTKKPTYSRRSLQSQRCKWKHTVCLHWNASNVESSSHTCAPDVAIVTAVAVAQSFIFQCFLHQRWQLLFVSVLRALTSSPVIDFTLVKHTYRFELLVCQSVSVLGLITLLLSVSNAFHTFQCGFSFRAWKYFYYCYCFTSLVWSLASDCIAKSQIYS